MGLGGTLLLLAVYEKALPALPISIFLGVVVYFLGISLLAPYMDRVTDAPIYF
jgi:presenilin 1